MTVRIGRDGTIIRNDGEVDSAHRRWFQKTPVYYLITLIISSLISLFLALLASLILDPSNTKVWLEIDWLSSLKVWLYKRAPIIVFVSGILGSIIYSYEVIRNPRDYLLSFLASAITATVVGLLIFIIPWVIQIIFVHLALLLIYLFFAAKK
jgi:hypothetical protein